MVKFDCYLDFFLIERKELIYRFIRVEQKYDIYITIEVIFGDVILKRNAAFPPKLCYNAKRYKYDRQYRVIFKMLFCILRVKNQKNM